METLYDADAKRLAADERVPWRRFRGKCVMVTGATGLVGGLCARAIAYRAAKYGDDIRLVLPVRDAHAARQALGDGVGELVAWDATRSKDAQLPLCDYIIHCACPTASKFMVEHPIETIDAIVDGTRSMLELARRSDARLCFVSSMEVYGIGSDEPLDESHGGELDAMNVRSSYPQAKQLAETLCAAFASQYGVAACVARLAQTFGPGIRKSDQRVFAEFARKSRLGEDIVLLTDGAKSNMYVYTADAVRALLMIVACGESGTAYNVANPDTFCSVYEMARMVAARFGKGVSVRRNVDPEASRRFAVSGRIFMNTARLNSLGWYPTMGLEEMYARMLDSWSEEGATIEEGNGSYGK